MYVIHSDSVEYQPAIEKIHIIFFQIEPKLNNKTQKLIVYAQPMMIGEQL